MSEQLEKYYLFENQESKVIGPFSPDELRELAKNKILTEGWQFTPMAEERWKPLKGSPLWQSIRPLVIFKDEMIAVGPPPPRKISQRTRDYFKLLVILNLACASLKLFISINTISLLFLGALFLIVNVLLVWVMFFILQRY